MSTNSGIPLNVRNVLIMLLKNAVNAAVLAAVQVYHDPTDNNFTTWHGLKGIAWMVGSAVLAREGTVLIPKILKWSQTNGGETIMKLLFALAVLGGSLLAAPVHAQTVPAPGSQYQVGAGFTSVSGPTDNGTLLTLSKAFSPRVWLAAKSYLLANPSGVIVATLGPRYRPPLSALLKPTPYFNSSKWYPFVDFNLGVVRDPLGHSTFAYGVGVGLDYEVSESVTMLLLQVDYNRSKFFPNGGILLGNPQSYIQTVATGIKFNF